MLSTIEKLKKDSRIAFRTPFIVKATLEWWAEKNLRSENQEAEAIILQTLKQKAVEAKRIFVEWQVNLDLEHTFKILKDFFVSKGFLKEKPFKEMLKTINDEDLKQLVEPYLNLSLDTTEYDKIVQNIKDRYKSNKNLVLRAFITYKFGINKENYSVVDLAPRLFVLATMMAGINPYEIDPGLYVFESYLPQFIVSGISFGLNMIANQAKFLPYREDIPFPMLFTNLTKDDGALIALLMLIDEIMPTPISS